MKNRITFALILVGITSMISQIILMRELLVIFYGNELSLGITLASWLFWVAFGSWALGRRIMPKIKEKASLFALCEITLAFTLPLTVLGTRFIPIALNFFPGEIIGILPMALATLILLSPVCMLGGVLFVLGCEIFERDSERAAKIGHVYVLEAAGATVGGLLCSFILIRTLPALHIMFLIGSLNLFIAFLLLWKKKVLKILAGALLLSYLFFIFLMGIDNLQKFSLSQQWRGYELLVSKNSVYGNIAVTKKNNLYSVFINGLYDFTVPDKLTSEKKAHFPLLEHPSPKRVLLIGGALGGQLEEVLKHAVIAVDYVELDPLVIDLARKYLPPDKSLIDPRVRIITDMDGRLFIKRIDYKYDVVIVNLPEPHTAQLNRFYTKEFYQELAQILNANGIICFSLSSNPNYISEEQSQLYVTLKNTLKEVFPEVRITPGETNYFLASKQKNFITLDWRFLMERMNDRNITTQYMREYYLYSELSKERIDSFQQRLSKTDIRAINTDFKPIAYYYDLVHWNTYFKYNLKKLFKAIIPQRIYFVTLIIYLFLFSPLWIRALRERVSTWAVLACVGTTGFAEITFQIVTLLSFQVIYGYVYYKLGLILTSYMIGLIFGGWWIARKIEKGKGDYRLFINTQKAIFIYPLILPLIFWIFSGLKGRFSFWVGSNIVFPFLPIIPGLVGGFQFPLANKLYLQYTNLEAGHSAGLTYGLDLFGSCLGALFTAVILLPIIGIPMLCLLTAGLNLVGLLLLLALRR